MEIVDDYNSHLLFNGRLPDLRLRRLPSLFLLLLTVLLCLPVLAVAASWLQWDAVTAGILSEMASTVLPAYVGTSLWLCLLVAVGVVLVGTASAAAVTLFDFPGRRTAEWALLLPLAMPAYVVAYAYTDFLQFSGPAQTLLSAPAPPARNAQLVGRCS